MLTFAFYKAPGDWRDRVIRHVDFRMDGLTPVPAIYSHCEYVIRAPHKGQKGALVVSASKRDGDKVRLSRFPLKPGHWDIVTIPGDRQAAMRAARAQIDRPYNIAGAVLSAFWCPLRVGRGTHCSAFCADVAVAGGGVFLTQTHRFTPQELFCALIEGGGRFFKDGFS